jgi:light-regulated signal transduction histidine kinase (bacteriophytochrome)
LLVSAFASLGVPWGIQGVSLGVASAVAVHYWIMTRLACDLTGSSLRSVIALHLRYLLACCPVAAICYLSVVLCRAAAVPDVIILGIGACTAALTYCLSIMIAGPSYRTDLAVLGRLIGYRLSRLGAFLSRLERK